MYLPTGQAVRYQFPAQGGHVVQPLYGGMYGDEEYEYAGRSIFVDEVLEKAPTEKYSEDVAKLEARIQAARAELEAIQKEARETDQERQRLLAKLTKIEELKHIEAFLDGKFTHAVITSEYGSMVRVETFDQIMLDSERRCSGEIKLLALFGTKDRKVLWKKNAYYDGSGSWTTIIPCMSLEEAEEKAREHIRNVFEGSENEYRKTQNIASAEKFGVPVPQELLDAKAAAEAKTKAERVAKLRKELEDASK